MRDKKIEIIDYYSLPYLTPPQDADPPHPSSRINHVHNTLMKKSKRYFVDDQGNEMSMHRDMKNAVKNIFKLFQSWVEESSPLEARLRLKIALEVLGKAFRKFNNNLIIGLSKDPLLRRAFILFAEVHGEGMICSSRIHDKESHL